MMFFTLSNDEVLIAHERRSVIFDEKWLKLIKSDENMVRAVIAVSMVWVAGMVGCGYIQYRTCLDEWHQAEMATKTAQEQEEFLQKQLVRNSYVPPQYRWPISPRGY